MQLLLLPRHWNAWRLNLKHMALLDWMVPAPAQGALALVCRTDDALSYKHSNLLEDHDAQLTANIEREFLKSLNGVCTMPIAASATIHGSTIRMEACILSLDGKKYCGINKNYDLNEKNIGSMAAQDLIEQDRDQILKSFT